MKLFICFLRLWATIGMLLACYPLLAIGVALYALYKFSTF